MSNHLARAFPLLGSRLASLSLADLPTPVSNASIDIGPTQQEILIKHDDATSTVYGGNKLRKLEYVLQQATFKRAQRVATFGTVGSHHAIATALFAKRAGFECTCFLSHQTLIPGLGNALRFHLQNGTEIVRYGGDRAKRVDTLRKNLHGRQAWVVPLGGSSWTGTVGFVNAGLELAAQIEAGEIDCPTRIYVALGTMGTAAGLALGLALAGLDIETNAIRVSHEMLANELGIKQLMSKTASMMNRIDPNIPVDLARRAKFVCRNEFFGAGYAKSNNETEHAIAVARDQLGLSLESTYSGKTMAGLLHDLAAGVDGPLMFWNTYNSSRLSIDETLEPDYERMPKEFGRYFQSG
jgi:D-cysteine desulfhydrase